MDLADEVEVDEAVVHRRHQRIGPEDRRAGDRVVATGRVDDDDVGLSGEAADGGVEAGVVVIVEHFERRLRQVGLQPADGGGAVFEIARQGPLAAVEVERGDAVAGGRQGNGGMDGGGRFARPALFIGEDDEVRLCHVPLATPRKP